MSSAFAHGEQPVGVPVGPSVPVDVDRPAALAAALAAGGRSRLTARGVAEARRLIDEAVLGAPPVPRLGVDRRQLHLARQRAIGMPADDGPFRPSPTRCRRAIGLDAVAGCLLGRHGSAADAVARVLDEVAARSAAGQPLPWWGAWWLGLGTGGRAAVRAEAVGWATRLWTGVDWRAVPGRAVVASRDQRWMCPTARWLSLHGRVDVRVDGPTGVSGPTGGAYLVVGAGVAPSGWRSPLVLPVLVGALAGGPDAVGRRVVGWWPDTGQVRVCDVDDDALVAVAAEAAAVAGRWWRASAPASRVGSA